MFRKTHILAKRRLRQSRMAQIILITLFWLAGEELGTTLHLPIPGSVIGISLVLAVLAAGLMKPHSLQRGAEWLLAEMLLFFVPAVPALTTHPEFAGWTGLKIIAVIFIGTSIVMLGTAWVVEFCFHHLEHPAAPKEKP